MSRACVNTLHHVTNVMRRIRMRSLSVWCWLGSFHGPLYYDMDTATLLKLTECHLIKNGATLRMSTTHLIDKVAPSHARTRPMRTAHCGPHRALRPLTLATRCLERCQISKLLSVFVGVELPPPPSTLPSPRLCSAAERSCRRNRRQD